MRNLLKKIINFFLKFLGLEVSRKFPFKKLSFDELHLLLNKDNCIIFDVGASVGQSIDRFKKIFPNSLIHSFEPIPKDFSVLTKKYKDDHSIKLNNFALGERKEIKKLYINAKSDCSSFYKTNINSEWLKIRSKKLNILPSEFTIETRDVVVETIDDYLLKNNITHVDILKIDTQGTEDKVLEGAQNALRQNIIKCIETEICFSDQYEKRLSFFQIEKFLYPNNYRLLGIQNEGFRNLKEGFIFFIDVIYCYHPDKI